MTTGVELATAWVKLVPSVEGINGAVADALKPAEGEAEETGKKLGSKLSNSLKGAIGAAAIGAAVVGAFKGLYEVGAVFDDLEDTIRIGTGATGKSLEGLVDVAKDVGKQVPSEFAKIGPVVADLNTRLGLSGETLTKVASQYLQAGNILGEDVDIQATTAAFSAFKLEGDAVSGAMDSLFQVSQATGVSMNTLATNAQTTAPAFQALGFTFEESIALLGSLDKAGLNSTAVAASMSKGLVTLAKAGENPQEAFQRVTGELNGFIASGDKASALDLASTVFGTKGAMQMVAALEDGTLKMEDLMGATGATGDTILGVAADTADFAETAQLLGNQAQIALEPLATAVFSGISTALADAMPMLEGFGDWLGQNTEVIAIAAGVIGVTLVAAMIAWTASIWASTVALLANPVTWIILAIVLLIAQIVLLVVYWDEIVKFVTDIWGAFLEWLTSDTDGFVSWWNSLWEGFASWIGEVWNGFVGFITDVWNGFVTWLTGVIVGFVTWWNASWTTIGNAIKSKWEEFTGFVRDVFNNFLLGLKIIGEAISTWWNDLWSTVGKFISDTWDTIVGYVDDQINKVKSIISVVTTAISTAWGIVWGGIVDFFSGIWESILDKVDTIKGVFEDVFGSIGGIVRGAFDGVAGVVKGVINEIIRAVNGAIDGINGVASAIGGALGLDISLGRIPMLAKGGTITGAGSVIVGEKGPELLTLPKGASVNPDIADAPTGDTYNVIAAPNRTAAQELADLRNRSGKGGL